MVIVLNLNDEMIDVVVMMELIELFDLNIHFFYLIKRNEKKSNLNEVLLKSLYYVEVHLKNLHFEKVLINDHHQYIAMHCCDLQTSFFQWK
jgi:hypothetical protein